MSAADAWKVASAVLLSLGGGGAIVLALSSWLGKVWANRLMERERAKYGEDLERLKSDLERSTRLLQGNIERMIFVSKTHFETEFKALADIWRCIAGIRSAMSELRPNIDFITDPNESREARISRRCADFDKLVVAFVDAVDLQSPFYPKEIYDPVEELLSISQIENYDLSVAKDRFSVEWYERGKKNFGEFCTGAEAVSDLIRERISKLSVDGGAMAS